MFALNRFRDVVAAPTNQLLAARVSLRGLPVVDVVPHTFLGERSQRFLDVGRQTDEAPMVPRRQGDWAACAKSAISTRQVDKILVLRGAVDVVPVGVSKSLARPHCLDLWFRTTYSEYKWSITSLYFSWFPDEYRCSGQWVHAHEGSWRCGSASSVARTRRPASRVRTANDGGSSARGLSWNGGPTRWSICVHTADVSVRVDLIPGAETYETTPVKTGLAYTSSEAATWS